MGNEAVGVVNEWAHFFFSFELVYLSVILARSKLKDCRADMAALQNLLTDDGENDIANEFLNYSVTVDDGEMCIDKPVDISNEDIDILDIPF